MLYTELATVLIMTHILLTLHDPAALRHDEGDRPELHEGGDVARLAPRTGLRPRLPADDPPGLSAGALLVFIISVGFFIIPALVGGTEGQMISNLIAFHMQQSNNWELAAALGTLLLVLIIVLYWIYDRLVGVDRMKLG